MSEENLINFSIQDGDIPVWLDNTAISENVQIAGNLMEKRESLDNNPFDKVFRQIQVPDDPFDFVFQEARKHPNSSNSDVVVENLLLLSDDQTNRSQFEQSNDIILEQLKDDIGKSPSVPTLGRRFSNFSSISSISPASSANAEDSAFNLPTEEEKIFKKSLMDSNNESSNLLNNSFSESSSSHKTGVDRTRVCGKSSADNNVSQCHTSGSPLFSPLRRSSEASGSNDGSPLTKVIAKRFAKLVASMPKYEDSCDDLMSINPNWVDSEGDTDPDLATLKIPFLEKPEAEYCKASSSLEMLTMNLDSEKSDDGRNETKECTKLDLQTLRERIQFARQKHGQASCDIENLIKNLKKIIIECSNEEKKLEASNLLETLSSVLVKNTEEHKITVHPPTPPRAMIRQGTFDIDKESPEVKTPEEARTPPKKSASKHQTPVDKLPNQGSVAEIAEQIGKLFGNESFNIVQTNMFSGAAESNSTYIVVVGTPAPLKRHGTQIYDTEGDGSPDLKSPGMRQRSPSLSLHDKNKQRESPHITPLKLAKTPISANYKRRSCNLVLPSPNAINSKKSLNIFNNETHNETEERAESVARNAQNEVKVPQIRIKSITPENIPNKMKFKLKQPSNCIRGPMKATVPVRKIAPTLITRSISPSAGKEKKEKPKTSTRFGTSQTSKWLPKSCSTPGPAVQSYLSPPKSKIHSSTKAIKTAIPGRKRSLSGTETMRETGVNKMHLKTAKFPQVFGKNVNKVKPIKVTSIKGTKSIAGNKENKLPSGIK